jgi:hypothetical protein
MRLTNKGTNSRLKDKKGEQARERESGETPGRSGVKIPKEGNMTEGDKPDHETNWSGKGKQTGHPHWTDQPD